jgi:hypothetical protein
MKKKDVLSTVSLCALLAPHMTALAISYTVDFPPGWSVFACQRLDGPHADAHPSCLSAVHLCAQPDCDRCRTTLWGRQPRDFSAGNRQSLPGQLADGVAAANRVIGSENTLSLSITNTAQFFRLKD